MLLQYDCKYLMVQTSNITMVMMPCLSFLRSVINMQGVTTKSALIQYSYKMSMSQAHPLGPCHKIITVFIAYYIIYSTLPLFHIHLQIMTSLLTPRYYYFHHPKRNTSTSILLTVQQKHRNPNLNIHDR